MKVLFNTYPTAFVVPGGGEVQLRELARRLLAEGVEVSFFDPWRPALTEFDLVHFFSVFGGSLHFCQLAKQLSGRLVISPGLWPDNPALYPMGEIQAMLDLADLIVPNSQAEQQLLGQRFDIAATRTAVIYNGVEPVAFAKPDPGLFARAFGVSQYLLNVGNIEPRKNQLRLIRAAQELDLPLVFVGAVRDRAYFYECRQQAGAKAKFLPPLEHDSPLLVSAYAGAALFVLPSLLETPGLVALEAAAAGCARIVVTGVGSAREYFGDGVEYVDRPEEEAAIRAAVQRALSRPVDRSGQLQQLVCEKFSWEQSARKLAIAYRHCLQRGEE
jgi:glycosyltransferase involved in cell wall biosynthesis